MLQLPLEFPPNEEGVSGLFEVVGIESIAACIRLSCVIVEGPHFGTTICAEFPHISEYYAREIQYRSPEDVLEEIAQALISDEFISGEDVRVHCYQIRDLLICMN